MKSIRGNFLLVSAFTISTVLVLAAFAFFNLFGISMERRVQEELKNYVNQVTAGIEFNADGSPKEPAGLLDPRFDVPYSGLYWQLDDPDHKLQLRSRSLWDFTLPLPDDQHDVGMIHTYTMPGPEDGQVIVQERSFVVAAPTGARTMRVAAAINRDVVTQARQQFLFDMIPFLIALGVILLLATFAQLLLGLRPLGRIADDLEDIRQRKKTRLSDSFPSEVRQLSDAVNNLLTSQEMALSNARKRSGDLAHGLKTPLTVLKNRAVKLADAGQKEVAQEIDRLVAGMEAHVQRELVLSRLAPSPDLRQSNSDIGKLTGDIVKTLKCTPKGESLTWTVVLDDNAVITVDPHDLRELLGNILENACKWASSEISISGVFKTDSYHLTIEDDGPGIETSKIGEMMDRGKRFDEKVAGTGIGLSIVRDIAALYGFTISIQNRRTSGLSFTIDLPCASSHPVIDKKQI